MRSGGVLWDELWVDWEFTDDFFLPKDDFLVLSGFLSGENQYLGVA